MYCSKRDVVSYNFFCSGRSYLTGKVFRTNCTPSGSEDADAEGGDGNGMGRL